MTRRNAAITATLLVSPWLSAYSWQYCPDSGNNLVVDGPLELSLNLLGSDTWNPLAMEAADEWNDVYGALDELTYDEDDGARCDHDDGSNAVEFDDWSDPDCTESASSSALAVTITIYESCPDGTIIEADVLVNTDYDWTDTYSAAEDGEAYSLHAVMVHEFGHALGLMHEDVSPAVMNTIYSLSLDHLHADDIAGARYLYSSGNDETNVAADEWFAPGSDSVPAERVSCSTTAQAGGDLYVEYVLENRGTTGESVHSEIFLSFNDDIEPFDDTIGYSDVELDAGSYAIISGTLTVPASMPPGPYWLGAYADPDNDIAETTSADNAIACPEPIIIECPDRDGDGFEDSACAGTDCNDGDADTFPGAAYHESSNSCRTDADGDGYGSDRAGSGVADGEDCDDGDASTYPGASDSWYDGVDADCAANSDYDSDGDGHDSDRYGGNDCDDHDPAVYAGAPDEWYDGVDTNCDGASDYDADGDGEDAIEYGGSDPDDRDPSVRGDIDPGGSTHDGSASGGCSSTGGHAEGWIALAAMALACARRQFRRLGNYR